MLGHDIRADLAMACHVLAAHRIIDLWGHLSMRIPRSEHILMTPRFGTTAWPRGLTAGQMLVVDLDGNIVDGAGELPIQAKTDLALYRRDPGAGACISFSPRYAMAAAIAGFELKPMTHMEAFISYDTHVWNCAELAVTSAAAEDLAALLARSIAVQQPGIAAWVKGESLLETLLAAYHLEYLGQQNSIIANMDVTTLCKREDSEKMWRQFAGWDHYVDFFHSLDPGPLPHPAQSLKETQDQDERQHILQSASIACKALWERDTLVAFLEHVSHRLPEDDRMIISAAKNFSMVAPEDMCVTDLRGNWINGPKPPGYKFIHAQILAERPDVQAIVHTHDLYGRSYALSRHELVPMTRLGLDVALRPLPVYPRCDLVVDVDVRRDVIDLLGDGPMVHEACHGTDFVADTLEQALVDAIQREQFLEMDHLARRFGGVNPMPTAREHIQQNEFSAKDWWWFYTAEINAPRRSAAGL
ncbi:MULTISPECIES: class II aldolase/adducin family protein [Roseinatronobacter]|uniref:Class II aldolase/adducin family protein n=1 Tax=Roseinatronobacter domitianus TaxID=2940293 RepID=A0ABT0LZ49_9RHOB|nr:MULTISPECIES: class II aldolase/adducin family protein [Roseibaca]MCL1627885.1 class II aldolase/adducin family protein [Roseibaca domitiana]